MKERDPQCMSDSVFFKFYNSVHGNKQFKLLLKNVHHTLDVLSTFFLGP